MTGYKYPFGVIWLSHSSLADFDKCPRLYYLHNVYKEMPLRKKIQVVNPYLTLGMTVHDTLERIRYLPRGERFAKPLTDIFEEIWAGNGGKRGGVTSAEQWSGGCRIIPGRSETCPLLSKTRMKWWPVCGCRRQTNWCCAATWTGWKSCLTEVCTLLTLKPETTRRTRSHCS